MKYLKVILESLLYFFIVILSQRIAYFGYSFTLFHLAESKNSIIDRLVYSPNLSSNEKALQVISQTQTLPIMIGWVIAIGLIGLVFFIIKQKALKGLNGPIGFLNILLSIVIGLGLVLLTNGVVNALSVSDSIPPFFNSFSLMSGGPFLWTLLIVGVIAPVFEELVFRGFIMGKLLESDSKWFAVLFQALLFSLSHFDIIQGTSVFLLGVVVGLSVIKTRSIKTGIVIHVIFNCTNLYLYQMDHHFYDVGQLTIFIIFGLILICFGLEKLKRKRLKHITTA